MACIIFPDHIAIEKKGEREGWSREQMYEYYCSEMKRMNPGHYNADGTQKSLFGWLVRLFK